ncbi:MAG: threonylcarbamoyl-AMP synthase [Rhodobacterales bacterium]|nr:MAG: threonylcarbamoyl-AMP synthase [Rhodobacterales bacterium]
MTETPTQHLTDTEAGLARAAQLLRSGQLVAFPTETVYGLGADARNGTAVAQIFAAKGRPAFNPLIVHVADLEMARQIAAFTPEALELARRFWPGPMTLVLPLREDAGLSLLVTAGLKTVGVRVPGHPVARRLLREFAGPVAAPSANPSGKISPTTAAHVLAGLNGKIAAIVDGGACGVGIESTIIGFGPAPVLLRPGGLAAEAVEEVLATPLPRPAPKPEAPNAPGQLSSHYAPSALLRLNATDKREGELKLGFGPDPEADLNLSETGDLTEAAANLFAHLHALDGRGPVGIAVAEVPQTGLGVAINDRLKRAAAPRP